MEVKVTPAIAQLCREAQDNAALPEVIHRSAISLDRRSRSRSPEFALQDARSAARDAAGKAAIPWDALKAVAGAVGQQAGSGEAPLLHQARPPPGVQATSRHTTYVIFPTT
jgi:hypothetical protein